MSRRLREGAMALLAAVSIYLLLALLTHSLDDPGWSYTGGHEEVRNLGGAAGAWFADVTYSLFGVFALLFPFIIAISGWLLFSEGEPDNRLHFSTIALRWSGFAITLFSGSTLMAMNVPAERFALPAGPGGILGDVLSDQLITLFGSSGGSLLVLALFLSGFTLFSGVSWLIIFDFTGAVTLNLFRRFYTFDIHGFYAQLRQRVERYDPFWRIRTSDTANEPFADLVSKRSQHEDFPDPLAPSPPPAAARPTPPPAAAVPPAAARPTPPPAAAAPPAAARPTPPPAAAAPPTAARPTPPPAAAAPPTAARSTPPPAAAAPPAAARPMTTPAAAPPAAMAKPAPAAAQAAAPLTSPVKKRGIASALSRLKPNRNEEVEPSLPRRPAPPPEKPAPPPLDPLPPFKLLHAACTSGNGFSEEILLLMSRTVEEKLRDFRIEAKVVAVHPGPVVTLFEIQLAPGIKASRVTTLSKDLARALSTISVRVVEIIPGKTVIGLEIPNEQREIVYLSEVLQSEPYNKARSPLTMALGQNITGRPSVADLAKMPHALIAGTTGSGKSVAINAMILSILYKATPEDVRMIMVDPKMLELSVYEGIPHLLTPVVTDMKEAANALRWCVAEMERRYQLMARMGVRNITGYNKKIYEAQQQGRPLVDPFFRPDMLSSEEQIAPPLEKMPYIVVVIDELADMMMVVGKKVEELIARLAQKARAAGIHLLLATQRPSVDVITGLIKANIPTRIAFQVSSRIDSRTILDQMGAEQLLGHGDMLFLPPGTAIPQRLHGAFVADEEVHQVVAYLKQTGEPNYIDAVLRSSDEEGSSSGRTADDGDLEDNDPLFDEAVQIVVESRRASISGVQRRLKIGYNRAARMIEEMERIGVVGPAESNGSRQVLAPPPHEE